MSPLRFMSRAGGPPLSCREGGPPVISRDRTLLEPQALAELFERFHRSAASFAYGYLQNHEDAEDVVHEVFAKTWMRPEHFDASRGLFSTWLFQSVRNRCLDRLRRRRSQAHLLGRLARETPAIVEPPDEPPSGRRALLDRLYRLLDALPHAQRRILQMSYFDGMTTRQISQQLDSPMGTVKTRKRKAISRLRKELLRAGSPDAPQ